MEIDQFSMLFFIGIVSVAAKYFGLLSLSGAAAAFFTGFFIMMGFGINGLVLMGVFFLTSSLWSRYKRTRKKFLGELHEKGSTRDWAQVVANGGTAGLLGLGHLLLPHPAWILAFAISLASANADTWASEIGTLSKRNPLSVKSLQRVPRGTSGAISGLGSFASAAGSLLIALVAYMLFRLEWELALVIFLFGFAGAVLDSFLGAHFQAIYNCRVCGLQTERIIHCNKPTAKVSGYDWINNDIVNFFSCFITSIVGTIVYMVFL
ncbi:MAG TPA: DUF92 domain-containing protein [Bacillus bacterium]|nr:DUF92 domain-containing protein [Bacillus sp. (in: firmicutes)]